MDLTLLNKDDFRLQMLFNLVKRHVSGNSLILDYGCGNGYIEEYSKSSNNKFVAVEKDKNLITFLKNKKKANTEFKEITEMSDLKLKSFDYILCLDVLEHIEKDSELLAKFRTLLKNSGKLILNVPIYSFLFCEHDKNLGHFRRYNTHSFLQCLRSIGFKPLNFRQWNTLGFFATLLFGKLLKSKMDFGFRRKKSRLSSIINKILSCYIVHFEAKLKSSPLGISLFVVAAKNE